MGEIEVMDAAELMERLTTGGLTEKDRLLVYRGGLMLATEELMRLHTEDVKINLEVLAIIRDIFVNLDEYESGVVLAGAEEVEEIVEESDGQEWQDTEPTELIDS